MPRIPAAGRRLRVATVVIGLITLLGGTAGSAVARQPGPWSSAELEDGVNSAQADGCPIESPNGLFLYFASTRAGAVGGDSDANDIWRVHRESIGSAWGTPEHLPAPVNSAAADFCPTPLTANRLYFVSSRGGTDACGAGDIFRTREHPKAGWLEPVRLGCAATGDGPNFAFGEFSPSIVETDEGTLLYYSSAGADNGDQDIYVSVMRADGTFGPGTLVDELNTAANDQMPNVSRDGLEIVFVSNRAGGFGGLDVWSATRGSTTEPWGTPVNLGPNVNKADSESRPSLSGDARRLHFGRVGDIWVSERTVRGSED